MSDEQVGVVEAADSASEFLSEGGEVRTGVCQPPGMGKSLRIKSLSGDDVTAINQAARKKDPKTDEWTVDNDTFLDGVIQRGCIKADGSPLFGTEHRKQIRALRAGIRGFLSAEILKLSGMGKDAVQAKAEELKADPSDALS